MFVWEQVEHLGWQHLVTVVLGVFCREMVAWLGLVNSVLIDLKGGRENPVAVLLWEADVFLPSGWLWLNGSNCRGCIFSL